MVNQPLETYTEYKRDRRNLEFTLAGIVINQGNESWG